MDLYDIMIKLSYQKSTNKFVDRLSFNVVEN